MNNSLQILDDLIDRVPENQRRYFVLSYKQLDSWFKHMGYNYFERKFKILKIKFNNNVFIDIIGSRKSI